MGKRTIVTCDSCGTDVFGGDAKTDPYQNLANAIVLQAVKDYRKALKKLKKQPEDESAQIMKNEIERFFRSDWCSELTSVDGNVIIEKLQAGCNE